MAQGVKDSGMKNQWSKEFPWRYGSKYFRTVEQRDAYAKFENGKRGAKRAGYPTDELGVARYLKMKAETDEMVALKKRREEEDRRERERIRAEFNLHPKSNLTRRLKAELEGSKLPDELRQYLNRINNRDMTDKQRVDSIRALYRDKTKTPQDIFIRVAQIAGVIDEIRSAHPAGANRAPSPGTVVPIAGRGSQKGIR